MAHFDFDPNSVNLNDADPAQIVCYINKGGNEYNGHLGARISALFVILITSTATTFFPVIAKKVRWLRIPLYVYLFARYFGSGVIVATAFIHLLDPAYEEIGPASCVGMTGNWAVYSWPPAIALTSAVFTFLLDFAAERFVEVKYGVHEHVNIESAVTGNATIQASAETDIHPHSTRSDMEAPPTPTKEKLGGVDTDVEEEDEESARLLYRQQIAAFYILEFGVLFHSVIIGLNLGVAGDEFKTLYPVIVFHQAFEGLGIGSRLSAIPFPKRSIMPWLLCLAYGVTTPIAIAIGLGVRTTYNPESYTANVVSGVLDSISAGILIYTGFVELLARDFLFNPYRTRDNRQLTFMVICVLLGAGIMALLGKWA
ncbi:ZIP zinc/iron transport family [Xylona heveae TC161]|uniref:ZIP zinc/iron transport family n=1 Tax=Xylona heveae (strain CBS 132557 / TC161) TaxID=1328760 RepID=A0A165H0E3_XYLHT|nr:ZIP zinc/iron transport family [Xylona heveae TC161]KZF22830.1 ZIP zinc/iron transport family [Xylona heveae TC161]